MNNLNPDDVVEAFVSILILLVGLSVFVEIYFDRSIIEMVTGLMEFLIYVFVFIFLVAVINEAFDEY